MASAQSCVIHGVLVALVIGSCWLMCGIFDAHRFDHGLQAAAAN